MTAAPSIFRPNCCNNSCSVRISLRVTAMLNGDSSTLYDRAVEHQPRAWSQWYALAMRRWFASVLLLLTALLPLQPLIASAQADASLPACCRRSGAHHCMMMQSMMLTDSGTQPSVRPAPCPLWKITSAPRSSLLPLLLCSFPRNLQLRKTLSSSPHPSSLCASRGPAPHARLPLQVSPWPSSRPRRIQVPIHRK